MLADGYGADLVVILPDHATCPSLSDTGGKHPDEGADDLDRVTSELVADYPGVTVSRAVRSGTGIKPILTEAVSDLDADLLVLPESLEHDQTLPIGGSTVETLAHAVDCDVVALNDATVPERSASILVALAGGPHSHLAVDTAQAIQRACGSWIELFHVLTDDEFGMERTQASVYLSSHLERLDSAENASTWVFDAADPTDAIIEQTDYYDVTVVGAPTGGRLHRFVFGSTTDEIRARAETPIVTVWDNRTDEPS